MEPPSGKAEAILAAALRVFAERGFSQARVEDIARAAGVGKGTIYEYFASKQAIFEQAVEHGLACYLHSLDEELAALRPVEEKLRRIARLHVAFVAGHGDLARIVSSEPGVISRRLKERMLSIRQRIEEKVARVLKAGMAEGRLRPVEEWLAARVFLGALMAAAGAHICQHVDCNTDLTADKVSALLLEGLRRRDGR